MQSIEIDRQFEAAGWQVQDRERMNLFAGRGVAEAERRLSVVEGLEAGVEANLKRAERLRQAARRRGGRNQVF